MNTSTESQLFSFKESLLRAGTHVTRPRLHYDVVSMAGGLLLLLDFTSLLLAATVSTLLYTHWPMPHTAGVGVDLTRSAFVVAVLASFILYDRRFGALASRGNLSVLGRAYALRFVLFTGAVLVLGNISQTIARVPVSWLAIGFALSVLLTSFTRMLLAHIMRRLQRQGALTEVIAVVGTGALADRLIQTLRQTRPETIELLGVFDDKIVGAPPSTIKSSGTLAQLIELGKTRKIDWILLTLPPTAEHRLLSMVQRLKALSVPIGLCPQHVGLPTTARAIDYVGGSVPVSLLADRPIKRWDALVKDGEDFVPRWIITLFLLPLMGIQAVRRLFPARALTLKKQSAAKHRIQFDNYDLRGFSDVATHFGQDRYGYVVTPNADHLIRLHEDASFRALYDTAQYVLLDSRFLSQILRVTRNIQLPVCTGSDLTARLFADVISPDDPLVLIGGDAQQAVKLRERYGLKHLAHVNPPMGFINDPDAVEACLRFIEDHSPFRFCLLAIGAPQQEIIAQHLKSRGVARGLALCIGASINFLTGDERRAPRWMQRYGMEWFYRLIQAPGRMAKRYLIRGPRVFGLLRQTEIVLRKTSTPALRLVTSSVQQTVPVLALTAESAEHENRTARRVS